MWCMASRTHDLRLGDDDIREENTKKGVGSKITPVIRCCAGSMHMVNTNKYLTDKNIGNGSRCKFKRLSSNPGKEPCGKIGTFTKFGRYQYKMLNMPTFTITPNRQKVQRKSFD